MIEIGESPLNKLNVLTENKTKQNKKGTLAFKMSVSYPLYYEQSSNWV